MCYKNRGKMELYYFSGTGNSLFISRELENRIPEVRLIPVLSVLNNKKIKSESNSVGFIFPIHALSIPWIMKAFLNKGRLSEILIDMPIHVILNTKAALLGAARYCMMA